MRIVRKAFARQMLGVSGVDDRPLEKAFAVVPREMFLGAEPWMIVRGDGFQQLPANDPVFAYQDVLFALAPDRGVNNGSPSLHAQMLAELAVETGDRVAHIGAGTGYYSAILAELVGETGHVTAVEIDQGLADQAVANLSAWKNVTVICGDGAEWPRKAVDRIYVNFAVAEPAAPWIERLAKSGRLVFPLGASAFSTTRPGAPMHAARGAAFLVVRMAKGLSARSICPAYFVCAEGALAADKEYRRALFQAFDRGGIECVRSLRWGKSVAPDRCWFSSPRFSLCYDGVDDRGSGETIRSQRQFRA